MTFLLTYDLEAMLLVEVTLYAHNLITFQETLNNAALWEALDLLPSVRANTYIQAPLYKVSTTELYSRSVREQLIEYPTLL